MACEHIQQEIADLKAERTQLQADLSVAAPGQKPFIVAQIKAINRQITIKQVELNGCLGISGQRPLATDFTGIATLTTSFPQASGPFVNSISLSLSFNIARTEVVILGFPPISTDPFDTPVGWNVVTISQIGGGRGSFDLSSGAIGMPLTLFFDNSIDLPFFEEDSRLPLLLGTGTVGTLQGSPLNRTTKRVAMVGTSTFSGGVLNGHTGSLILDGIVADLP